MSEWSTGWNKSLWFRISPQTVLVSSCSRGHCRVTVGACAVSLADRVKFLCRQENLCTTHCQVTHKINFKQSFRIKGESCYYVMGSIHLAQEIYSVAHTQITVFNRYFEHFADAHVLKVRHEGFSPRTLKLVFGCRDHNRVLCFSTFQEYHITRVEACLCIPEHVEDMRYSAPPVHVVRTSCFVDVQRFLWKLRDITAGVTQNSSLSSVVQAGSRFTQICVQLNLQFELQL